MAKPKVPTTIRELRKALPKDIKIEVAEPTSDWHYIKVWAILNGNQYMTAELLVMAFRDRAVQKHAIAAAYKAARAFGKDEKNR